jgi:hypothetical protein
VVKEVKYREDLSDSSNAPIREDQANRVDTEPNATRYLEIEVRDGQVESLSLLGQCMQRVPGFTNSTTATLSDALYRPRRCHRHHIGIAFVIVVGEPASPSPRRPRRRL